MTDLYGVFVAASQRDMLLETRVNRAAAEKIKREMQARDPGPLYFVSRLTRFEAIQAMKRKKEPVQ